MVLSLVAPLANTALVAPTSGGVDCGLTVSQSGVAAGTTVQLTWWTVNAQNGGVTMSDNGSTPVAVNPSGSIPLTINANHSFALTVRNTYGSKTCTASITSSTQTNKGPTCAISVTPGTHYAGQGVQIVWYTQNATAGQVGGVGDVSGSQLSSGSATIYPQQSTAVSMGVANQYGSNSCSTQVVITPRQTTTPQQPIYNTTSYRPVTTTSYAPSYQPLSYRPTTSGTPSYSSPSYSNARYPSPLYSSGWYPDTRLGSPSYTNGLGDYTLTNIWNNAYNGETLISNHDCSGLYCDSQPYSWGYASNWQADGTYGPTTYRIGGDGAYGYEQYTFDGNNQITGYNREIPNSVFNTTPTDGTGGWYDAGTSETSAAPDTTLAPIENQPSGGNGLNDLWDNWDSNISGGGFENPSPSIAPSVEPNPWSDSFNFETPVYSAPQEYEI
jgi:hypothetical protein